jgi:hypothetical protein
MTLDDQKLLHDLLAATRLTPSEYDAPVWDHHLAELSGYEEGLFPDVEALLAKHAEEEEPTPAWVWASKPVGLALDAQRIARDVIDMAIDNGVICEGAAVSADDVSELQTALDAWSEKMRARGRWGREVDRSRVIVLDVARFAALLRDAEGVVLGVGREADQHEAQFADPTVSDSAAGPLDDCNDRGAGRAPMFFDGGGI